MATAVVMLLCALAMGAPADPAQAPAIATDTASVLKAAQPVVPVVNDLHPRPLGLKRETKTAAAGSGSTPGEQTSAGAALWSNPIVRTAMSLFVVLVLIVALAAIAKKVARKSGLAGAMGPGGRAPEGLLEVLGRYPLVRGQTLILLKVDSRVLLLSQTTPRMRGGVGTLTTLCEMTDPEEVASILVKAGEHAGESSGAKFSALLHAFDRKHTPADQPDHTELDGRHIRETEAGDRAELWDDRAIPAAAAAAAIPQRAVSPEPVIHKFPQPLEMPMRSGGGGGESFGAIKQRLHALRGEAHR